MKPKSLVTVLLLGFVAVSLAYIVVKQNSAPQTTRTTPAVSGAIAGQDNQTAGEKTLRQQEAKIIAWYFHGNRRCGTCKKIESYVREAIKTGFAEAVKDGRMEFRAVNVELPQNEHFIYDYELSMRSVVISQYQNDKQQKWSRLDGMWSLLADKHEFIAYFQREAAMLLAGDS